MTALASALRALTQADTSWTRVTLVPQEAAAVMLRIAYLEAGIRRWASECAECGGTGEVRVESCGWEGEQPCDQCKDIREYLK